MERTFKITIDKTNCQPLDQIEPYQFYLRNPEHAIYSTEIEVGTAILSIQVSHDLQQKRYQEALAVIAEFDQKTAERRAELEANAQKLLALTYEPEVEPAKPMFYTPDPTKKHVYRVTYGSGTLQAHECSLIRADTYEEACDIAVEWTQGKYASIYDEEGWALAQGQSFFLDHPYVTLQPHKMEGEA